MKAVIFDMDGVIIDSEGFWKQAESEVFSSLGVKISPEFTKQTQSMTTNEVARFWFEKSPWETDITISEVEQQVIDRVCNLIHQEGSITPGVKEFIKSLKEWGIKTGLATNSPYSTVQFVLAKAQLKADFDVIISSDLVQAGKPNPDIYLFAAKKLAINPSECLAIEDSVAGIIAAKAAGMNVAGFTQYNSSLASEKADYQLNSFLGIDFSKAPFREIKLRQMLPPS